MHFEFTNTIAGSQAYYQQNQELAECLDELQMFVDLPPNTWVHFSTNHEQFITTAKHNIYIPGSQTVATYWKGHTQEQLLKNIFILLQRVTRAFQTVYFEAQQAERSDIRLKKCIELKVASQRFKMVYSGTQESGGLHGLLQTHQKDAIFSQLKSALKHMNNSIEADLASCKQLIPQDLVELFLEENFIEVEDLQASTPPNQPYISQNNQSGLMSGFNTTVEMFYYYWGSTVDLPKPLSDESYALQRMRSVLGNPSAMLQGSIINAYIEKINGELLNKMKLPVIDVIDFYFRDDSSISQVTVARAMDAIRRACALREKDQAICIPIVFSGYGWLERKHIACILIKDNIVEYYDPKGESAHSKFMADSTETLYDLLEVCQKEFAPTGKICENLYKFQLDAHNCGVFCCEFLDRRLLLGQEMGWQPSSIESECLYQMRKTIFLGVRDVTNIREQAAKLENSISLLTDSAFGE